MSSSCQVFQTNGVALCAKEGASELEGMSASEAISELYSHFPEEEQLHYQHDLGGGGKCAAFDWSKSFVGVNGKVCLLPPSADVKFKVIGISLGHFDCDLTKDCGISLNAGVAKGKASLFLLNGNELWIDLSAKVLFNGSIHGKYKIITL
jgi:hypothetical protein